MEPFSYDSTKDDGVLKVFFRGKIGELVELPNLIWKPMHKENKKIVIDLEKVDSVNSTGIRIWLIWIETLPKDIPLHFTNVPRFFVDQINMIVGVVPKHGVVDSFYVPYYCEECDEISHRLFTSAKLDSVIPCRKCDQDAELDIITDKYLQFNLRQCS
jgi:hypothetical protein